MWYVTFTNVVFFMLVVVGVGGSKANIKRARERVRSPESRLRTVYCIALHCWRKKKIKIYLHVVVVAVVVGPAVAVLGLVFRGGGSSSSWIDSSTSRRWWWWAWVIESGFAVGKGGVAGAVWTRNEWLIN